MNPKRKKINDLMSFSSCPICRYAIMNSIIPNKKFNVVENDFNDNIFYLLCNRIYLIYTSLFNLVQGIYIINNIILL
jgi:hypothetical protein